MRKDMIKTRKDIIIIISGLYIIIWPLCAVNAQWTKRVNCSSIVTSLRESVPLVIIIIIIIIIIITIIVIIIIINGHAAQTLPVVKQRMHCTPCSYENNFLFPMAKT